MSNSASIREFKIIGKHIELYKLLKLEGLASSGGQAKLLIAEGLILVNGEKETRKRKKLVTGDKVEFDDVSLQLL